MDRIDRQILKYLQRDSAASMQDMAQEVGLSGSACHRRVRALEAAGLIRGYRAELDPEAMGLTIEVLVQITLTVQDEAALDAFEQAVTRAPEVLECWLLAGQADYMLRIMAEDMADYDRIHRHCLSRLPGVASMQSSFSLRRIKPWQGYSL
ncbi:MAG: Lrp/AsnC family transcriptional regulator [Mangrovicoccus sp.]